MTRGRPCHAAKYADAPGVPIYGRFEPSRINACLFVTPFHLLSQVEADGVNITAYEDQSTPARWLGYNKIQCLSPSMGSVRSDSAMVGRRVHARFVVTFFKSLDASVIRLGFSVIRLGFSVIRLGFSVIYIVSTLPPIPLVKTTRLSVPLKLKKLKKSSSYLVKREKNKKTKKQNAWNEVERE